MTLHAKVFLAGLIAATLPTSAVAQVVAQPVPVQGQPAAGQPAAVSADGQQQVQQAIAHALGMAIHGSELQFLAQAARQASRGGQAQDQDADRNQDRRDRDANAEEKDQGRRDRGDAKNDPDDQGRQQAARQAFQQLRQQAWNQFQGSTQLLQAADNDLRALEGNATQRAGDPSASARRLHAVASQYANTLRDLSGANNRPAGSPGGQDDQDQAGRGDQDRGQNRREAGNLSRTEIAQATLINHAVCEALGAFRLNQATGGNRGGVQNNAGQQLQAHARQGTARAQQLLKDVVAGANWRDEGGDDARGDDRQKNPADNQKNDNGGNANQKENDADNARGGQRAQGQASVRSLAQQAQHVIDTLQRSGGSGPAGAVTPGADR